MPGGFINGGFNIGRTMFPVPFGSRFTPAVTDYFNRLGALRVTAYDAANAALIDRLVGNGGNFWPASGAFCAMAGYLYPGNGANLIPLKDGHDAGTLNAFVSGDWNAVTGLKGDGSTKYVDSNRNNNVDGQNDQAMGVYMTSVSTGRDLIGNLGHTAITFRANKINLGTFSRNTTEDSTGKSVQSLGFYAISRSNGSNYRLRAGGAENSITRSSQEPLDLPLFVFQAGGVARDSNARLPFYHIGPNLNGAGELAELDAALTEWKNALASA